MTEGFTKIESRFSDDKLWVFERDCYICLGSKNSIYLDAR